MLNRHNEAKTNDTRAKTKGREYANQRRHAKPSNLQVGDKVVLKQRKRNKFTTKYELEPYTIIEHKGTKIVAENQNHIVTRNASFFKKIKGGVAESEDEDYRPNVSTRAEINDDVEAPVLRRSTRRRTQRTHFGNTINPDLIIR